MKQHPMGAVFFLLYRKLRFRKAKKIIFPAERPLRVLGDGQFENGRRVCYYNEHKKIRFNIFYSLKIIILQIVH